MRQKGQSTLGLNFQGHTTTPFPVYESNRNLMILKDNPCFYYYIYNHGPIVYTVRF
jgi:hypothetical protein